MDLSIQFKDKELINTNDITLNKIQMIILNDISFNIIITIWYIIFIWKGILAPNPFFALIVTAIQSLIIFIYLIRQKLSTESLIKYVIMLIILKIMPLISLYTYDMISVNYFDVYSTAYIYLIYIFITILINNIILHRNINVAKMIKDDVNPSEYKEDIKDAIYDKTYNDIIKQII